MLFGGIRNELGQEADQLPYPYLEIIDQTSHTCATALELGGCVVMRASTRSTIGISVGSGASNEGSSLTDSGGIPFTLYTSRGIITVDVYLCHHSLLGVTVPISHGSNHMSLSWTLRTS